MFPSGSSGFHRACWTAAWVLAAKKAPAPPFCAATAPSGPPTKASAAQKQQLAALSPAQITATELAGEKITAVLNKAPGNGAPIGGIKVCSHSGWYAARPSGTEDIYKIYGESFQGDEHLQKILQEAQATVDAALAPAQPSKASP